MKAATEQSLRCLDSKLCPFPPFASDFDNKQPNNQFLIQFSTPTVLAIVGHEMCRWTGGTRKGRSAAQLEKLEKVSDGKACSAELEQTLSSRKLLGGLLSPTFNSSLYISATLITAL